MSPPAVALAALAGSVVLALALLTGITLLRRWAGGRHAVLLAALVVYATAPLLGVLGARLLPEGTRRLVQPVARVMATARPDGEAAGQASRAVARTTGSAAATPFATAAFALGLWALGAGLLLVRLRRGWRQVRRLQQSAAALGGDVRAWAEATLCRQFPGQRLPRLLVAPGAATPLVAGLFRPTILLPPEVLKLGRPALAHVLVHEMAHLVRGDLLVGLLGRLLQALHWPNPLVQLGLRALARAREECCDDVVLAGTRPTDYARTLLAVASARPGEPCPAGALGMGAAGDLERRIRRMLEHLTPGRRPGRAGARGLALALGLAGAALVGLTGTASTTDASPTPAPARTALPAAAEDDAARALFADIAPGVTGAFVLLDLQGGGLRVVNTPLAAVRVTPASTFKVVIAAAALESGVLADERVAMKWNGVPQQFAAWNRDSDLHEAMKLSSNWYFQQLSRLVGTGRVHGYAEKLGFGPGGPPTGDPGWIDGGLAVSALDQVDFFGRFAAGRLPLQPRTQQILRRILVLDERAGVTLRGKTGMATLDGGGTLAWLAGTVEGPDRRFAYATLFRGGAGDGPALRNRRHATTRRLLARYDALPAEMAP